MTTLKRTSDIANSPPKKLRRPDNANWLDRVSQCHVCSSNTLQLDHGVCKHCQTLEPCMACCVREVPGCFYEKELLHEVEFANGQTMKMCAIHAEMFTPESDVNDFERWPVPPSLRQGFVWVCPRVFCIGCQKKIKLHVLEEQELYIHETGEFDWTRTYRCANC